MSKEVLVLGAGMVGICTAIHLQQQGFAVTVIDQSAPGTETSYGNAGIIQTEAVEPYAFPREWASLFKVALKQDSAVNYHLNALPDYAAPLLQYWRNSSPKIHQAISQDYAVLIRVALLEHQQLIAQAQAEDLILKNGWIQLYRSEAALQEGIQDAERRQQRYGVPSQILNASQINQLEPNLKADHPLIGGIHWTQPWSVIEPGELVQRYARLFERLGGVIVQAQVQQLQQKDHGWQVQTDQQALTAPNVVLALGPWSSKFITELGYHNPLFIKRGYHQHYTHGSQLSRPMLDAEYGYVLAPMKKGTRLTTGAEFAHFSAPATPVQLEKTQQRARDWLDLGEALPSPAWLGRRPCSVDMKPYIGAAPRYKGLWFNFGHGHQGFTLGAASGRLLAEMMTGNVQLISDPNIFSPNRIAV